MVQTKCCVLMLDWDDTSMVCEVAEVLLEALRYRLPWESPAPLLVLDGVNPVVGQEPVHPKTIGARSWDSAASLPLSCYRALL